MEDMFYEKAKKVCSKYLEGKPLTVNDIMDYYIGIQCHNNFLISEHNPNYKRLNRKAMNKKTSPLYQRAIRCMSQGLEGDFEKPGWDVPEGTEEVERRVIYP